jgi:hypothetical protein
MTAQSGAAGKVTFGSGNTFVDGVNGWKLDPKSGEEEITPFKTGNDAAWKRWASKLKEATGSINLAYVDLGDSGQLAIWNALGGAATPARFYINASHYLSCNIIINSFPFDANVDGIEGKGVSISFRVDDSVTYT